MRTAILVTFLVSGAAQAHPDYEVPITEVNLFDPNGRPLRIVLHFRDGIGGTDPSKIIIYDAKNEIIAETEYYRGIIIEQPSDGRIRIYGIAHLSFWNEWNWTDGKLEQSLSPAIGRSLWMSLQSSWIGYGIWTAMSLIAIFIYRRRMKSSTSGCLTSLAWIWLLGTIMYGSLSILIMLGLTCIGTPLILWAARSRRSVSSNPELPINHSES